MPIVVDHIKASKFKCECRCTESLSHSTLKNANNNKVTIKAADTIISTDLWGPRFCKRFLIIDISYSLNVFY